LSGGLETQTPSPGEPELGVWSSTTLRERYLMQRLPFGLEIWYFLPPLAKHLAQLDRS